MLDTFEAFIADDYVQFVTTKSHVLQLLQVAYGCTTLACSRADVLSLVSHGQMLSGTVLYLA